MARKCKNLAKNISKMGIIISGDSKVDFLMAMVCWFILNSRNGPTVYTVKAKLLSCYNLQSQANFD